MTSSIAARLTNAPCRVSHTHEGLSLLSNSTSKPLLKFSHPPSQVQSLSVHSISEELVFRSCDCLEKSALSIVCLQVFSGLR